MHPTFIAFHSASITLLRDVRCFSKIYCHTYFEGPELSVATVALTSPSHASAFFSSPILEIVIPLVA